MFAAFQQFAPHQDLGELSHIMAFKCQATPEALGQTVAALGDADERICWLAGSALASL